MAATKSPANHCGSVSDGTVIMATMVVLESPEPIKPYPKAQRRRLSNPRLRKLAEKYKPPQSWYGKDEEGLY